MTNTDNTTNANNSDKVLRIIRYADCCDRRKIQDWWVYDTPAFIFELAMSLTNSTPVHRVVWVYDPESEDYSTGDMRAVVYVPYSTGAKAIKKPMPADEFDPREIAGTLTGTAFYDKAGSNVCLHPLEGCVPQAAYLAALAA